MKSLDTIQKIAKVAYVLTRIAFVFCIVGLVLCLVGIVSVLIAGFEPIRIGSVTLHSIGDAETDLSTESMMVSMVIASLKCAMGIVLSRMYTAFYRKQLDLGTPFDFALANDMKALGIKTIVIPAVVYLICAIIIEAASMYAIDIESFSLDNAGSITQGIFFIILSLIVRASLEERAGNAV